MLDLDPLLFGDALDRQPLRCPAATAAVADEGVLQPPGQAVLAAWLAEPVRHEHEGRLGDVEVLPAGAEELPEDLPHLQLIPQMPCEQDRSPGQGVTAAEVVRASERSLRILAQGDEQVIELLAELIQSAEIGHDPLCCFSWNWRNGPFELHLLACKKEV